MYRDFALSIMKNLDYYATEKGHVIDVFGTCSIPTTNPLHVVGFKSILDLPEIHNYDGIILCYDTLIHEGMAKDLVENLLTDTEAPPVVCIRARIEGFYNVIPDNRSLMYDIAKHVISKCKTGDIGFVTGMDDLIDSAERREGFEKVMKEFGYEVDEKKIFHGNYWITQGPEMTFSLKKTALSLRPSSVPTTMRRSRFATSLSREVMRSPKIHLSAVSTMLSRQENIYRRSLR